MKTHSGTAFYSIIIAAILFFTGISSLTAREKIEKTMVEKKYNVNKGALLRIDHKFGEVNCKNWNEEAISVKVTAIVETSDQSKAESIFSRIRIDVSGNSNEVSVESDFNDKLFGNEKNNLTINIEIFMPKSIKLQLDHKFGNAYVEIVDGISEINSEYGNLEVGALTGENSSVEIGFGQGKIRNFISGDLVVNYSNFDVTEAKNLKVEASYSDFEISKVVSLKIENEGGKTVIGQVDILQIASKFSDCEVGQVAKVLNIENEYGGFKVRNILKSFTNLTVENSFGAIDLNFEAGSTFDFKAQTSFCTLEYPKEMASFSMKTVSATESFYEGVMGKGTSTGAKAEIESEYGGVTIIFK